MFKAIKVRLYPNAEQEILLAKHFGCVRWIYNRGLAMKTEALTCSSCGQTHDRDLLAARNIKRFALHPQNKSIGRDTSKSTLEEVFV